METIISKFSALQIWLSHRRLPISFPNTFSCFLPNIEKKVFLWMMTLSGAKMPQPSNIQQRVVAFSYQVPLSTYQPPNFFILSLHKGLVYHQLSEADLGLLQHPKWSALRQQLTAQMERFETIVNGVNYYLKALHLGCCRNPRSASSYS